MAKHKMRDVIVVGGGPAGLTATMYALKKKLDVLMTTRDLGGKTNYHLQLPFIERHMVITGDEIINRFAREIEYLEYALEMDHVEKIEEVEDGFKLSLANGKIEYAHAVIVATGAKPQLLDVPGEREFMMRGLCYSATSYAPLFIDRVVGVIGDGSLALRSTAELARVAKHATLLAPSQGSLGSPLGKRVREMDNVEVLEGCVIKEIKGDMYARSIVVMHNGGEREIEADGLFVELDLIPRVTVVEGLVDLDEKSQIKINLVNETSRPGIFAAGDVTNAHSEQVLISIGEGAKAALSAYEYLIKKGYV